MTRPVVKATTKMGPNHRDIKYKQSELCEVKNQLMFLSLFLDGWFMHYHFNGHIIVKTRTKLVIGRRLQQMALGFAKQGPCSAIMPRFQWHTLQVYLSLWTKYFLAILLRPFGCRSCGQTIERTEIWREEKHATALNGIR